MSAPAAAADQFLSIADLARRYGVSKHTVHDWNKRRIGPLYFRVGERGTVRYRLSDVLAWEAANSHGGQS